VDRLRSSAALDTGVWPALYFSVKQSETKLYYRSRRDTGDRDLARRGIDDQSLSADEAEANSFMRAEELTADGDHAGAAIWRRITVAIEPLTDTTRPPN
jgi:hypothetical protein